MTYEFAKYPDETLVVFSDIRKKKMEKNILEFLLKDQLNKDLIQLFLNYQATK